MERETCLNHFLGKAKSCFGNATTCVVWFLGLTRFFCFQARRAQWLSDTNQVCWLCTSLSSNRLVYQPNPEPKIWGWMCFVLLFYPNMGFSPAARILTWVLQILEQSDRIKYTNWLQTRIFLESGIGHLLHSAAYVMFANGLALYLFLSQCCPAPLQQLPDSGTSSSPQRFPDRKILIHISYLCTLSLSVVQSHGPLVGPMVGAWPSWHCALQRPAKREKICITFMTAHTSSFLQVRDLQKNLASIYIVLEWNTG